MTPTDMTPVRNEEPWPYWAKAMFAAMLVLTVAVVVPWILMWSMCIGAMGGMDGMREMMERAPVRP